MASSLNEALIGTRLGAVSLWLFLPLLLSTNGCRTSIDQRQEEARIGSYNRDPSKVSKVQLILMYSGFGPADIDGVMGPESRAVLRDFQESRGLPRTGYVGDATWTELMKMEQKEGPFTVERLQWGLRNAGHDPGSIDGEAGRVTMDALSGFQQAKGLSVTGRLNPETWAALQSLMPR